MLREIKNRTQNPWVKFGQLLGKNSSKQVAVEHNKQTGYPFVIFNKT
jgi:hypothetical protein